MIKRLFLTILVVTILLPFASASSEVWQGQYHSGGTWNDGTYTFNFTVYDNLTGGNICYTNSSSINTDEVGYWRVTEQVTNCNNVSEDYYLNINIAGADQTPRRFLQHLKYARYQFDDSNFNGSGNFVTSGNVSAHNYTGTHATFTGAAPYEEVIKINVPTNANGINLDNDGTSAAMFINQDGNGQALNIDSESTSANVVWIDSVSTTGEPLLITANSLTNGEAIKVSSSSTGLTSGHLGFFEYSQAGDLSAKVNEMFYVASSRTHSDAAANSESYDGALIYRADTMNNAGGSLTTSGSVLKLWHNAAQSAGTLTDSVIVLEMIQDADSNGDVIDIVNNGGGNSIDIEHNDATATAVNIDSATGSGWAVNLDADNLTTGKGLSIRQRGELITSGELVTIDNTESGDTVAKTGQVVNILSGITDTSAGTITQNYDTVTIDRRDTSNNAGLTYTSQGSVLRLVKSAAQTAGTLNDAVTMLEISSATASTGKGIWLDQNANGVAIHIDSDATTADTIDIDTDVTTEDVIDIQAPGHTSGNIIGMNSSTTTGNIVDVSGDSLTTGKLAKFYSNSADNSARQLVTIHNDHPDADTATTLQIINDGNGNGISINSNGVGYGMSITQADNAEAIFITSSATTNDIMEVQSSSLQTGYGIYFSNLNSLTTGGAIKIDSNSADTSNRNLIQVINDNTASVNTTLLNLRQDADLTAPLLNITANAYTNGSNGSENGVFPVIDISLNGLQEGKGMYIHTNTAYNFGDGDDANLLKLESSNSNSGNMILLVVDQAGDTTAAEFASGGNAIKAKSTEDGASVQVLDFRGDSPTPADDDEGYIVFQLNHDGNDNDDVGWLKWIITNSTEGGVRGAMRWVAIDDGSDGDIFWGGFEADGTGLFRVNSENKDINFQVSGDDPSSDNLLFIDAVTERVGINTGTPSFPLEVRGNGSANITIWAEGNISAGGYITRTSVFDQARGSVWDYIKNSSYYLDKGAIDHSKFYGYSGEYTVTDYDDPVVVNETKQNCTRIPGVDGENSHFECEKITVNKTTYPNTKTVGGVDIGQEIDVLRQAIFEIKTCTDNSADWATYKTCIANV